MDSDPRIDILRTSGVWADMIMTACEGDLGVDQAFCGGEMDEVEGKGTFR